MRTVSVILRLSLLQVLFAWPLAAADRNSWPEAVLKLKPPFATDAPPEPPSTYGKIDLKDAEKARTLVRTADELARAGRIEDAIKIRHWFINDAPDAWGRVALAALYAAIGRTEGAVYWLQRAAIEEGVLPEEIKDYPALDRLTASPDWAKLNEFLTAASEAWTQSTFRRDILLTPKGYQVGKPLPVLFMFHGHRGGPESMVRNREAMQEICDKLHVAIYAISGPVVFGPNSFGWPLDLRVDAHRIEEAIKSVKDRFTPDTKRFMTVGFSAGAQIGLEIAAFDPKDFLGSLVFSPGRGAGDQLAQYLKPGMLVGRRFLITNGSEEESALLEIGNADTKALNSAGAKTLHETISGLGHQLPANYENTVHDWAKLVLEMDGKP